MESELILKHTDLLASSDSSTRVVTRTHPPQDLCCVATEQVVPDTTQDLISYPIETSVHPTPPLLPLLNRIPSLPLLHLLHILLIRLQVKRHRPRKRQHGRTMLLQLLEASCRGGSSCVDAVQFDATIEKSVCLELEARKGTYWQEEVT